MFPSDRPTDLSLSYAARAHVPKSRGRQVAAYTAGQRHPICNLHDAVTLVFGPGLHPFSPGASVRHAVSCNGGTDRAHR
jgi:hypothetical protein